MTRILLAAAVVAGVFLFGLHPIKAAEAPWCGIIELGNGDAYSDCRYATLEQCVPNVLAGNRGFCNQNPAYHGQAAPTRKARRKPRVNQG